MCLFAAAFKMDNAPPTGEPMTKNEKKVKSDIFLHALIVFLVIT